MARVTEFSTRPRRARSWRSSLPKCRETGEASREASRVDRGRSLVGDGRISSRASDDRGRPGTGPATILGFRPHRWL